MAESLYNNEQIVIKQQSLGQDDQNEDFLAVLREIAILAKCNHPNIIPIKGVNFSSQKLQMNIIFPQYYKDLQTVLFSDKSVIPNKQQICCQIIQALDYIHKAGLIHLDLKPPNILFKDQTLQSIALVDFGISKIQKDDKKSTDVLAFSGFYCPPEVSQENKSNISSKSDIFSLGIVLYELVKGERAWQQYLPQGVIAIYNFIHAKEYHFFKENQSTKNQDFDDLILDCVKSNPDQRPSASETLQRIKKIKF